MSEKNDVSKPAAPPRGYEWAPHHDLPGYRVLIPTPAKARSIATKERELRYFQHFGSWPTYRESRPEVTVNEALAGADGMTASIKPTAEIDWSTANITPDGILIPTKADQVAATQQPARPAEAIAGYCRECHKALPQKLRADAQFCCEAHSRAFRRRAAKIEEANKHFRDYQASAHARAETRRTLELRLIVAEEMTASAARCGIEANFFAASGTIVAIHDEALPQIRFRIYARTEARPVCLTVEMRASDRNWTTSHPDAIALAESAGITIDGPERKVTLFGFEAPAHDPDWIGRAEAEVRFRGDPGTALGDGFDPPQLNPKDTEAIEMRCRLDEFLKKRANNKPYVRPTHGRKHPNSYLSAK